MSRLQAPRHIVSKLVLALLVVGTAALTLPVAAQAEDDELSLRVTGPITFSAAPGCELVVTFGLSSEEGNGSGTACILSFAPPSFPCDPPSVCDDATVEAILSLPDGTIEASWTQFETFTPDFSRLSLRVAGSVTGGTGEFDDLVGADISGRGRVRFEPDGTGTPKNLVLEIGQEEEDREDD